MTSITGLVAGACCALVIACAAAKRPSSSTMAPPPAPAQTGAMPQDSHAQIEELDREITDARTKLGLPEVGPVAPCTGPDCGNTTPMVAAADPSCHPGTSDTCSNTCTLADSICGNATKICDLAKQMQGDTWAADHCTSATATCHSAHTRCCGCQ